MNPPSTRLEVIRLLYKRPRLTYKQIAERLGITVNHVKVQVCIARKKLGMDLQYKVKVNKKWVWPEERDNV